MWKQLQRLHLCNAVEQITPADFFTIRARIVTIG